MIPIIDGDGDGVLDLRKITIAILLDLGKDYSTHGTGPGMVIALYSRTETKETNIRETSHRAKLQINDREEQEKDVLPGPPHNGLKAHPRNSTQVRRNEPIYI
jgi:hypothetical protein